MTILRFPGRQREQVPLADLLPRYERALEAQKRRERGVEMYARILRRVFRALGETPTQVDLNYITMQAYQESIAHLAGSTIENALYAVRSFAVWSIEQGFRDDDPTERLHWPRVVNKVPDRLPESEIRALLVRVRTIPATVTNQERWRWKRNARAIYLMLYAGLRLSEAAALKWRDVDLEAKELVVREEAAKGGNERKVSINRHLLAALSSVPEDEREPGAGVIPVKPGGKPLSFKGLEKVMDRWMPVALTVHAHQLRHAFATRMHRKGVPVRTIQALLGHKSLETTMRYLGIDPDDAAAAVEVLDW